MISTIVTPYVDAFCFSFFRYPSVGDSKSVLTNSIPFKPKSSHAIMRKSRFFQRPARTSSTRAHSASEISSLKDSIDKSQELKVKSKKSHGTIICSLLSIHYHLQF